MQDSGSMRGEGVVDGEELGSSGGARGGSNRRRASAGSGGLELAIRAAPARSGEIDGWRRLSEVRGVDCVQKGGADRPYL
jgi:hypothetical protein